MANQAEQLQANPSPELQEFLDGAQQWSTASESTVRKDFPQEDGSVLSAMSHNGGDVYYEIAEPPPPATNGATGV